MTGEMEAARGSGGDSSPLCVLKMRVQASSYPMKGPSQHIENDRLKLMRACGAQLSQVFGLYDDSDAGIMGKT